MRDFLTDRKASVRFQGRTSRPHLHLLGTPQGSCLSPLLFNILLAELQTIKYDTGVQTLIYADDTALVFPRRNLQKAEQPALNKFQHQCSTLGLKINATKYKYMIFGLPSLNTPLRLGDDILT